MPISFPKMHGIGVRLGMGFGTLLALLLGMAALGAWQARDAGERLRQIVEVNNPKSELASRMLTQIDGLSIVARTIALLNDPAAVSAEAKALLAAEAGYLKTEEALQAAIAGAGASPAEQSLTRQIREAARRTIPLVRKAADEGREGANMEAVRTLAEQVRPAETLWRQKVVELMALERSLNEDAYRRALQSQRTTLSVAAAVVLAALAFGALLGWQMTRSVKASIDSAIGVAERIAQGDLSSSIAATGHDEIGRLLAAIGAMQERLRELVGAIRGSTHNIEVATKELALGTHDLSHRTDITASSLQATAASIDELTGTVQNSALAVEEADRLAQVAAEVAGRGESAVRQVVTTMQEIHASSRHISEIIAVIDTIAFQTNILSLNAAVEAAQAGERGRGFAVVASEVRALAERSASSAREIKALIGASVERVEAGTQLVRTAGATMNDILRSVEQVTHIIGGIRSASSEQSIGIDLVNKSVSELDRMTQQNAALVEQSTAAAESLREQAARLSQAVEIFRLHEGASVPSARIA